MSKKNLIILLLAVVVFVLLFLPEGKSDNGKTFPKLDGDVDKIEFTNKEDKITLLFEDEKWSLAADEAGNKVHKARPGNKIVIDPIVNFFKKDLKGELVSDSGAYGKYGLEEGENKTFLFYSKGTLLGKYVVGNQGNRNNSFYFLDNDDEKIYQVEGDVFVIDKGREDLINKQIYEADAKQVERLKINIADRELVLTKTEGEEPEQAQEGGEDSQANSNTSEKTSENNAKKSAKEWLDKNEKKYSENKINDIINIISRLSVDRFLDDRSKSDFTEEMYRFELEVKDAKSDVKSKAEPLSLIIYSQQGENFVASRVGSDDVFLLTDTDTKSLDIKNFSSLE